MLRSTHSDILSTFQQDLCLSGGSTDGSKEGSSTVALILAMDKKHFHSCNWYYIISLSSLRGGEASLVHHQPRHICRLTHTSCVPPVKLEQWQLWWSSGRMTGIQLHRSSLHLYTPVSIISSGTCGPLPLDPEFLTYLRKCLRQATREDSPFVWLLQRMWWYKDATWHLLWKAMPTEMLSHMLTLTYNCLHPSTCMCALKHSKICCSISL